MQYEDFVLQIVRQPDAGFAAKVLKSPAGEGAATLDLPFEIDRLAEISRQIGQNFRGATPPRDAPPDVRRDLCVASPPPSPSVSSPQQLGEMLYRAVFSRQIRTLYDQSLGRVGTTEGTGLRLKLKIDPSDAELAELCDLPWEYLRCADTRDFLSLSRSSPIVRYLDVPRPAPVIPLPAELRILVVVSSPAGLAPLDLERERGNIESAWGGRRGVRVAFLARATTAALRQRLLEQPFHVLHFMGHGGFDPASAEGVLYFETLDGEVDPVSGHALAVKLKDFSTLGLIFLNACNTARATNTTDANPFSGVANALVLGGLPAVLAMQFPISDRAAIDFSDAFYRRLASGDSVDEAVTEGRQAVHSTDPSSMEWGTPVLFVRVPDGTIFQKPQRAARGRPGAWAVTAVVAALALALSIAFSDGWPSTNPPQSQLSDRAYRIDRDFLTNLDGVAGRLTTIEVLPNGRIRLDFELSNLGPSDVDLDFHLAKTYLADEDGNRYGILPAAAAEPASEPASGEETEPAPPGASLHVTTGSVETVGAAQSATYSLEFAAPPEGTRQLHVGLASDRDDVEFEFFAIRLPEDVEGLPEPPKPFAPRPDSDLPAIAGPTTFTSAAEGFAGTLRRVELLADQRMRWDLEFFNRSDATQQLSLRYDRIYLYDNLGNYYPVMSSSSGGRAGGKTNAFRGVVQRAVRADHWLEFPAPVAGATSFALVLVGDRKHGAAFNSLETRIPEIPDKYAAPPPTFRPLASTGTQELDLSLENNIAGLTSTLTAIEFRGDGKMRWHLAFHNRSKRDLQIGFDYPRTYLSDAAGRQYSVRGSDPPAGATRSSTFELRRGLRSDRWMDFDGPMDRGVEQLTAWLFSHDERRLTFEPLFVEPLQVPADFEYPQATVPPPPAAKDERPPAPASVPVSFVLRAGEIELESDLPGLKAKLTTIERLDNGRLRWHFEFLNRAGAPLEIGFDASETFLYDNVGKSYAVLASDTSPPERSAVQIYRATLQPGESARHWFEFSGPARGATSFFAAIASHDAAQLRFQPLQATLR